MKKIFLLLLIITGYFYLVSGQNSALNFQNLDYMKHGDFVYCGHPYTTQLTNKITIAMWIKWTSDPKNFAVTPTNHENEGSYSTYISYSAHDNNAISGEDLMFTLRNDKIGNKTQFVVRNSSGTTGTAEVNANFTV